MNKSEQNVSHQYKCIFVHIPKSAGTSINEILEIPESSRGHKSILDIKDDVGEDIFNNYTKIAVVRNPWDRVYSLYKMRVRDGYNQSFKTWFFETVRMKEKVILGDHMFWKCQYDMISDKNNNIIVDNVLRYETLEQDWDNFRKTKLTQHNIGPLKFFNISSNSDNGVSKLPPKKYKWWKEYNETMIDEINYIFDKDVVLLKYYFPQWWK